MLIPQLAIHALKIEKAGFGWMEKTRVEQSMENLVNDIICFLFQTYAFHTDNHNMSLKQILVSHLKFLVVIKVASFM